MLVECVLALLVTASTSWCQDHGPPGQETVVARLPLEALPLHYQLELAPYFQAEGDFQPLDVDGLVTIHVMVQDNQTDTITLHAGDSVSVNASDVRVRIPSDDGLEQERPVSAADWDEQSEMLTLSLDRPVSGELSLVLPFLGRLRTDMDGFYLSEYQAGGQTKYLAATQFAPMSARKAFPCFDEPALKASFALTVYPPAGFGVLSNTAPVTDEGNASTAAAAGHSRRSVPSAAGRAAVRFAPTRPMPTYLVGVVVYDEATFTADEPAGALRVWSRADAAAQRRLARDVAAAALLSLGRLFPDYFQHMGSKLDQVAVPDFYFSAMENWGIVTYRERALLTDDGRSSSASRRSAVTTMVHELAHQWFGDLVTPDFWNVLWLKEGFATYWAYHTDLGRVAECWRLRELFVVEQLDVALHADASASTHALTSAPNTAALYDDMSYSKGGSILRMLRNWLGEDQFNSALNTYLLNRMYDSAVPEDLFSAVREVADPVLADYLEIWTSTPGYPVISVTREGRSANLTQERYLASPSENASASSSAPWPSLVSYVVGLDFRPTATRSVWVLGEQPTTIADLPRDQPLFLNLNWTGFFRVNYDARGWQLIREQLRYSGVEAVPRQTRAQLVSDAFSLARSGHLDYATALDLSLYLDREEAYLPWAAAFRAFDFLDAVLASTEYYPAFQNYVRYLLGSVLYSLTLSARPDDDHWASSLRGGAGRWLCRAEHTSCLDYAWQLAVDASSPGEADVDADMRAAVYCVWARDGGRWGWLWQYYLQEATVATERQQLLAALGCSRDRQLLTTYLGYTLDKDKIKPQDVQTVFTGVCATPVGVEVATDFIINNAAAFSQGRYAEKIITGLAKRVTTEEQLAKMESLRSVEALQKMNATVEAAMAAAAAQVDWAARHVATIGDWLETRVPPSGAPRLSHSGAGAVTVLAALAVLFLRHST